MVKEYVICRKLLITVISKSYPNILIKNLRFNNFRVKQKVRGNSGTATIPSSTFNAMNPNY